MGYCFVPQCNHRKGCRLFTFPRDEKKLKIWTTLIRRKDAVPNRDSRICSCHFVDGDKTKVPSIFAWNVKKMFSPASPEKRRRMCSRPSNPDVTENSTQGVPNQRGRETSSSQTDLARTENRLFENSPEHVDGVCTEDQLVGGQLEHEDGVMSENELIIMEVKKLSVENEFLKKENARLHEVCAENEQRSVENEFLKKEVARLHELCAENKKRIICQDSQRSEVERLSKKLDENHLFQENKQLTTEIQLLKQQSLQASSIMHEAENYLLTSEVKKLQTEQNESRDIFLFRKICDKDELISHFTGLPNKETFFALLKLFDDFDVQFVKKWKVTRFSKENQLFICLLKLRRGLSNLDLATRFKVDRTTIANIFISWVLALHHIIVKNLMTDVPSRFKNQVDLPECFRKYPNTRLILDCTEVVTASPSLLKKQCEMYSNYKHRITSKALIGIAPNGTVVFVSDLYAGSTSDRDTVIDSGVLNCLVPGDSVMADKGFNIDDLMPNGVTLNIPPFKDVPQFTQEQIVKTTSIATARIHIERAIARIKVFMILQFIPQNIEPYASEIFQVCAALTNFRGPLIKDDICQRKDE